MAKINRAFVDLSFGLGSEINSVATIGCAHLIRISIHSKNFFSFNIFFDILPTSFAFERRKRVHKTKPISIELRLHLLSSVKRLMKFSAGFQYGSVEKRSFEDFFLISKSKEVCYESQSQTWSQTSTHFLFLYCDSWAEFGQRFHDKFPSSSSLCLLLQGSSSKKPLR